VSNAENNPSTQNIHDNQQTEVVYNDDKILHKIIEIFSSTNESIDVCLDNIELSMHVLIEPLWYGLCELKVKGVKLRIVTEMTNQSSSFCEKMMQIAEVRHMDGIRSNFKIVDGKKCLLYVISMENSPSSHAIISNVNEMVDSHQHLFETLWNKAIPSEQKIKEMGFEHTKEKTEVSFGVESSTITILNILHNSEQEMNICADKSWPSVAMGVEVFRLAMFDISDRHSQSRFITEITKDNIKFCKELLKVGKLRHLEGVKGNFAVSEKEYMASATMKEAQLLVQVIHSNVKAVVESHQYLFETLWNKAIPSEQKIKEIEEGIEPVRIEVVNDSKRTKKLYMNMIENASNEILLLFPTHNAFTRQENAGIIQLLIQAVKKYNVKVRILMPSPPPTILSKQQDHTQSKDDSSSGVHNLDSFFSVRHIQPMVDSDPKSTILVTDKKHSLVIELKDDTKKTFEEAIGLSTYSNSKPGVLSYVSIFENLWLETELYEHIRNANEELQKANEQLKINDKMQKEFINIAAHELRTPTQAILSLADLLPLFPDKKELVTMIQRNAKRLQRLIKDTLDVTKIESQQLIMRKDAFNIHDLISLIADYRQQTEKLNTTKKIKISCQFPEEENVFLIGDKERISEVISNIIDNAIKFIEKEGSIHIHAEVEKKENSDNNFSINNHVLVKIKDTGVGISEEIFPRLFTRFASKSINGIGLGLYISRSIIEAHGGKIWAENNKNGNGATFTIRLPLYRNNKIH
jgi:two-component system, OmpR family, sensor histidine kinase VicK